MPRSTLRRTSIGLSLCTVFGCLLWYSSARQAAEKPTAAAKSLPLRAVIVAGGPNVRYNQYAIESNARYVESLTSAGRGQTILFADGSKKTRSISVYEYADDSRERRVLGWLLDKDVPGSGYKEVFKASTLRRIDGPATRKPILSKLTQTAARVKLGENGLIYFTGHGGNVLGDRPWRYWNRKTGEGSGSNYSLWGGGDLTVPEVARALKSWPKQRPLTTVMVQCHSGGFSDLMFEDADPGKPLANRDFCGFFASTADRQSSGCTSEVDEEDYEDFTTHFFAALSGRTRYGTTLKGADFDANGKVSMLEAYAWANVHDDSIDVPVSTSDAYLRSIYKGGDNAWLSTKYSVLIKGVAPWQRAILDGLSKKLELTGEDRLQKAWDQHATLESIVRRISSHQGRDWAAVLGADADRASAAFYDLERGLNKSFPGLRSKPGSTAFKQALPKALRWLRQQPAQFKVLQLAMDKFESGEYSDVVREAQFWRFLRAGRTVMLERQLAAKGSPAQKAAFARMRTSESRNPILPQP